MNQTRISLLAAVAISLPLATTTAQAATPPGPLCCTRPTGCSSATVGMKQVYFAPSAFPGSITLQPNATNLTLIGTGSFSSINGNSLANGIVGSAGNDTITDGGGKDTIFVGSDNNITGRNSDIVFCGTNGEADTVKLSPDGIQDKIHIGTSLEMSPPAPYLGTNHTTATAAPPSVPPQTEFPAAASRPKTWPRACRAGWSCWPRTPQPQTATTGREW